KTHYVFYAYNRCKAGLKCIKPDRVKARQKL
ncbi:unnamed protein product, partial [marine sediment metagenome]